MKYIARDNASPKHRSAQRPFFACSAITALCLSALPACVSIAGDAPTTGPSGDTSASLTAPAGGGNFSGSSAGTTPEAVQGADAAAQQNPADLRTAIGVNPNGPKLVEVPKVPAMSVVGYVQPHNRPPMALLELADKQDAALKHIYLVKVGTEIPVTISGRIFPVGRGELTGLSDAARPSAPVQRDDAGEETQIILTVTNVTQDGVTVKAGLLAKTIVVH
jgi:hypothetical protein